MKAFFNDMETKTLPSDLVKWAEKLACIQARNLRQQFFNIQEEIATIMYQGVIKTGGTFYGGYTPSNREIDERLAQQGDGRMFMQMAKTRSGFINAPPKPTQEPKKTS